MESAFGDAPNADLSKVLAQFCHVGFLCDGDFEDSSVATGFVDPGADGDFLMADCMPVAGVCHILHNATEDLTKHLAHFSWFYEPFQTCVSLLRRHEFRKVFCHTCLTDDAARPAASAFGSFSATLVGHRWGYLIAACQELASLETALRLFWSTTKLSGRDHVVAQHTCESTPVEDHITNDNIAHAAVFVTSPERWAYLHMLMHIGEVLNRLEAFFKACPCHPSSVFGLSGDTWSRRHKAFERATLQSAGPLRAGDLSLCCPMQGCQAPFAAAGLHWDLMDSWFAVGHQDIMMSLVGVQDAAGRDRILEDWAYGRVRIAAVLKRKLGFTDCIPFKLAAIAHPDPDLARKSARVCLQQFAGGMGTAASDAPKHHRLTVKFLHTSGVLYDLLVQFVEGASLGDAELRPLKEELCALKFIRMSEQSVERCHALGKMGIRRAPRHAEAYWSLCLRGKLVERRVQGHAGFLEELGEMCGIARDARQLVQRFRLQSHAEIAERMESNERMQVVMQAIRPAIYRCDRATQQACHAAVARETNLLRRAHLAPLRSPSLVEGDSVVNRLLRRHALEHFRSACLGAQLYSCTAYGDVADLAPVVVRLCPERLEGAALAEQPQHAADVAYNVDEDEIPDCPLSESRDRLLCDIDVRTSGVDSSDNPHVFFSLLSPNPRLMKGIAYGSGVCQGFRSDEMCVSILGARWKEGALYVDEPDLGMQQGGCLSHVVLALPRANSAQLRRTFYAWDVVDRRFLIRGLLGNESMKGKCHTLVQDMLSIGAFRHPRVPPRPYVADVDDPEMLSTLAELQASGIVEQVHNSLGRSEWVLTGEAVRKAHLTYRVARPRALFRSMPASTPLRSLSTYHILDRLLLDGWSVAESSTRVQLRKATPYTVGGPQVIHVVKGADSVSRSYLLCLGDAAGIFADGAVAEIRHGGHVAPLVRMHCNPGLRLRGLVFGTLIVRHKPSR